MELEIDPSGITLTNTYTNTNTVSIDSSNIDISGNHKITLNDTNGITVNNLTIQPTNTLGSATNVTIDEISHLSGVTSNIQTQFNNIIDGAPGVLNTLNELATAINGDAAFATTITTSIDSKVSKTGNEDISGIKTIKGQINYQSGSTISGDMIPESDDTHSLGSVTNRFKHLFVGNSSIWMGEDHKINATDGKLRFRKRKKSKVPRKVAAAGGSEIAALKYARSIGSSASNISELKLNDWLEYGKTLDIDSRGNNINIEHIYEDGDSDFEEETTAENTTTSQTVNVLTSSLYPNPANHNITWIRGTGNLTDYEYAFIRNGHLPLSQYTWYEHESKANQLGGNLASIHSLEEQEFLVLTGNANGGGNYSAIIGIVPAHTWKNGQTWIGSSHEQWSDGTTFDYRNYKSGEPNNGYTSTEYIYWNHNYLNNGHWADEGSYSSESKHQNAIYKRPYHTQHTVTAAATNVGSGSIDISGDNLISINDSSGIVVNNLTITPEGSFDICGGNFTISVNELSKLDGISDNIQSQINTAIASGVWDQGVGNVYYNSGNVGIGTDNPTSKFQVKDGSISVSGGSISVRPGNEVNGLQFHSGTGNTNHTNSIEWYNSSGTKRVLIGSSSDNTSNQFRFWENGSQYFVFLNDSNNTRIGINRTDPQYALDVTGDIRFSGNLYQGTSTTPFSGGGGSVWTESNGNVSRGSGVASVGLTFMSYGTSSLGGAYCGLSSNVHGSMALWNNGHIRDNNKIHANNTHGTMKGAGLIIPGNGHHEQNCILFYTQPKGPVTAGSDVATGNLRMIIDSSGNVGIGTSTPRASLDVINGSRIVVQGGTDGGNSRGLAMWTNEDSNWAIYMGQSGSGKAFDGGTACDGKNFSQHAIRIRTNSSSSQGFLYENTNDACLFSVRGSDGMTWFSGNVGIGKVNPTEKLDVTGNIKASGTITSGAGTLATETYVNTQVTNLIGGAPGALDTLNELAAAIGDDANYASSITTSLAGKVATTGDETISGNKTFSGDSEFNNINFTGTLTQNGTAFTSGGDTAKTIDASVNYVQTQTVTSVSLYGIRPGGLPESSNWWSTSWTTGTGSFTGFEYAYTYDGNHQYDDNVDFTGATYYDRHKNLAIASGAHLIFFTSEEERNMISGFLTNEFSGWWNKSVILGNYRVTQSDPWLNIDGTTMSTESWAIPSSYENNQNENFLKWDPTYNSGAGRYETIGSPGSGRFIYKRPINTVNVIGNDIYTNNSDASNIKMQFESIDITKEINIDNINTKIDICGNNSLIISDENGINLNNKILLHPNGNIDFSGSLYQNGSAFSGGSSSGGGAFTSDSGKAYYTGGNVGIGTTNPNAMLHLRSSGDVVLKLEADTDNSGEGDNPLIHLLQDGGAREAKIGISSTNDVDYTGSLSNTLFFNTISQAATEGIQFATNSDAKMTILSTGNVGIGTNNPSCTLTIGSNATSDTGGTNSMAILAPGENADAILYLGTQHKNNANNTGIGKAAIIAEGKSTYSRSNLHFCLNTAADNNVSASLSDSKMTILNEGNVGIGTTNPACKLHVKDTGGEGKIIIENESLALLQLKQPTSNKTYNIELGRDDGELSFRSTDGEKIRIKENGNVGIGNTTPSYKLDVAGDINFTGNLYQNGSAFSGGGGGSSSTLIGPFKLISTGNTNENDWGHFQFERKTGTVDYGAIGFGTGTSTGGTNVAEAICVKRTGEVGIGTSNPTASLFINGAWNNLLSIKGNSSSEKEMRFFSGSSYCGIAVNSSNTQAITFQHSTGNVGIGTSNPLTYLHIKGSHPANTNLSDANDFYMLLGSTEWKASSYRLIGFGYIDSSTKCPPAYIGYKTVSASGNTYGDLIFGTRNGTGGGAPSERMRIRYNGQVGIGTTTPEDGYKLHIKGSQSSGVMGRLLLETNDWSSVLQIKSGSNSNYMYTNSNGDLYFNTTGTEKVYRFLVGSSEKMQISNNGYVGIGTSNPSHPLTIYSKVDTSESGNGRAYTSSTTASWTGNIGEVSLRVHGRVWATNHYIVTSDSRIKTDISLISDDTALNLVNALESYEYHYIDPERKQPMKTIGFIAQEVNNVVPNAVSIQKDFIPDEMRMITEPIWNDCSYSTIRYEPKTTYTETVTYKEGPLLDGSGNPVLDQSGNQIIDPSAVQIVDPSGAEHIDPSGIVIEEWHPKWKLQIPDLDMSSNNTGRCRFYFGNDPSGNDETMKELTLDPSMNNTFEAMDERYNNVFFYGKEVNDFHTLDKAQIFALHHSAIQELSRKNDALVSEKETMQTQITTLLEENNSMKSRLEALEAAIINLQNS